jgi:branched-chain amino acid transport system ATP-binding protein
MSSAFALEAHQLECRFGNLVAVRGVSFQLRPGETMALIGPNGAGKSTLLNLLGGQLRPTSGRITYFGQDITGQPPHRRASLGIARSFQVSSVVRSISVEANAWLALVGIAPFRYSMLRPLTSYQKTQSQVFAVLEEAGLWGLRDKPAGELSHGDQRRLEIALTLACHPRLLLLDEPTAGLTTAERTDFVARMRALPSEVTVVLVDHDIESVFSIARRVMVMHHGATIADGDVDSVRADPAVTEAYGLMPT